MKKVLPKANNKRTLGPISDLERHLPSEWWKTLFNSLYLKTDGDVVENNDNTTSEVNFLIESLGLTPQDRILDLCCGQGRHVMELAKRGFMHLTGIDRSRYLIRLARKRAERSGFNIKFSEGDARKVTEAESSFDCVYLMGNSFGYFERPEDDINVLENIKKILVSEGRLALDITNGAWMRAHFEPRSWEWIDQNHFVCRERSLSHDKTRIISREVIVHAEKGVIADQFYAERLYDKQQIAELLEELNFSDIEIYENAFNVDSTRGQDLGMMANRIFLTAYAPKKSEAKSYFINKKEIAVLQGDPKLQDPVKKNGVFNLEDLETINIMKQNLAKLSEYKFRYIDNHKTLINQLQAAPPRFVFNLCDEGYWNDPQKELHVPALLEMLNIPYSGAAPAGLAICYNKSIVRSIAVSLDIPVPDLF